MVVDDERDMVSLIKFLLEKDGHKVSAAFNGAEALAQLGVEPADPKATIPDLMVIDVMMPIMDGFSACARLGQEPRTRSMPILVLTARSQMRDLFQAAPNVAAYIDKPFDPKKLRELIRRLLLPPAPFEADRA